MVLGYFRLLATLCLALAGASPAAAVWLRAESPNFIVFSEGSEARLRQQVVLLEDYAAVLRRLNGLEDGRNPAPKLRVYLIRGRSELQRVTSAPRSAAGFYVATPTGIAAFVDASADDGEWVGENEILFHEYAHHFMMQNYSAAYPAWYVEGFAEYLSTARFTDRHIDLGRPPLGRGPALLDRAGWLPIDEVLFGQTRTSAEPVGRFYAQSWLLTHYLFENPERRRQFARYLSALDRRQEPRAAFQASFGTSPADLQRQLGRYVTGSIIYRRMDRASVAQSPQVTVTRLPASADRLLLMQAAMLIGRQPSDSELARIRSEAARRGDPFARRVLAEAETMYGDPAAAERLLAELLAASPQDVDLLYLRGMAHIVAARDLDAEERTSRFRRARVWFARAHRLDPNHFQTLYRYAQSFSDEPEFVSENNTNVLLLAQQLAPQVAEIRMNAAAMLLMRGDYGRAEALLAPLASTAHQGELAEAARAMLEQARAHDNRGIGISFEQADEEQETPPPGEQPGAAREPE